MWYSLQTNKYIFLCKRTINNIHCREKKMLLDTADLASVLEVPATNREVYDDIIRIYNASLSDSAVYQCKASNRHGTLLANANIMIMSE